MTVPKASSSRLSDWPRDPYKGLNYFSAADTPLFSQREDEIDEVAALLTNIDTRLLMLYGGTGTGKSSFLRAGLVPRLQTMPPEYGRNFFFLSEAQKNGSSGDPLLVRATNDPVARIFEALLASVKMQWTSLPDSARLGIQRALAEPLPRDRLKAIPSIFAALKALTAPPQRDTLVLIIDQAEEVLTLPATDDGDNVQQAFVELLEQICFRLLDLRLIVALRTEYYGRFLSLFRIRPTHKLTPTTESRPGLIDHELQALSDRDIAAAIRRPTLNDERPRKDGLPQPRSKYRFVYRDNLPEIIAADLLRHSGETSVLPVMQIVCKQLYERVVVTEKQTEIREQDYIRFGRADGAIDSFLVRAIRDAAAAADLPPLSDVEVDSWLLVLSLVVGRTEGGTVQTLVASEQDLLAEADRQGITSDAARTMLSQMVDPDRRLLRAASGESGTSVYSLGHDSLGPSLLRRSAQASVRAAAEARLAQERKSAERRIRDERHKSRLTLAIVASLVLVLVAAAGLYATIAIFPIRERVNNLTNYAAHDSSDDFRLRLLLLAAALRITETWPGSWFINAEPPKNAIRRALLRSPIYGGTFAAAAGNADGRRVVRLENNKLVVHDLASGNEGKPSELPGGLTEQAPPPSIGLITQQDGVETLVAFRSVTGKLFAGNEQSRLIESSFELPNELREGLEQGTFFIPRADIFGGHLRVIFMHFAAGFVNQMGALRIHGSIVPGFKADNPGDDMLDWRPLPRQAIRQPILAEDCDTYAFLGRNADRDPEFFRLWLGRLGKKEEAKPVPLRGRLITAGAVAIARGCGAVLLRDDTPITDTSFTGLLHIVPLDENKARSQTRSIPLALPEAVTSMVVSSLPQSQPMFAAAPLGGDGSWRVGWQTAGGLALVDVRPDENPPLTLLNNEQMLTGVEAGMGQGSLSLSPDGLFVLMIRQQNFSAPFQLRAFNLNFSARRDALTRLETTAELIRESCRTAKFQTGGSELNQTGSNKLTKAELLSWLGRGDALQPCAGIE